MAKYILKSIDGFMKSDNKDVFIFDIKENFGHIEDDIQLRPGDMLINGENFFEILSVNKFKTEDGAAEVEGKLAVFFRQPSVLPKKLDCYKAKVISTDSSKLEFGKEYIFIVGWIISEGKYAGDWAMIQSYENGNIVWTPETTLEFIAKIDLNEFVKNPMMVVKGTAPKKIKKAKKG
jgi:hypothetical protein